MMKNGHAYSGATAGLGVAALTGAAPYTGIVIGVLCAGAALIPDIDHPGSTISRTYGPISEAFSEAVNGVSARVYDATRTRYDDDRDGGHRGLTHTWPFALGVGLLCAFVTAWHAGLLTVLFLCISLALRGLLGNWAKRNGWLVTTATAGVLTWLLSLAMPDGFSGAGLGAVVGFGCIVHCWGDSLTLSGCPWMWPVKIAGQRWYPIGTPQFLRFRAGGDVELKFVLPFWMLTTGAMLVNAIPGSWAALGDAGTWVAGLISS